MENVELLTKIIVTENTTVL